MQVAFIPEVKVGHARDQLKQKEVGDASCFQVQDKRGQEASGDFRGQWELM